MNDFFEENPPERVIKCVEQMALEYVTSSPHMPPEDKARFMLLNDLKYAAERQLKEK